MTVILEACEQEIQVGFNADCTAAESVGDPVIFSDITEDKVEKLTSNVYDGLVVGFVLSKISAVKCFVVVTGVAPIGSGFGQGEVVWVSTSGGTTTTKPATGHLQVLGNAASPTSISVNIEQRKTIQA